MRLVGYRIDKEGNQMLLFTHKRNYYVRVNEEDIQVELSYRMVKDGTYQDEVRGVPYFVLHNRVYPLKSFESLTNEQR